MNRFKEVMACVAKFFLLVAYVAGIIGGLVSTATADTWPVAVCILVLGALGWPKAKQFFLDIKEYKASDMPKKGKTEEEETKVS